MTVQRRDFDVIVAGAGAAGASAAYYLRQAGLRVLVVEKARLPRYKACGGAIPRPILEQLPFTFDSVTQTTPAEVRLSFPGLAPVDVTFPDPPVAMVMRSEFDAHVLGHSDAEVLEATPVTGVSQSRDEVRIQAGDRVFTARYVVGADGATSLVARSLGLRGTRRLGGTLAAEVPLQGNAALQAEYGNRALFVFGATPWGYAWIFPKNGLLSVGISRFRPGRTNLRVALRREMSRLGIGLEGVDLHGHPIPCYQSPPWRQWRRQPQERLSTGRCLLVGDAAGLVDPTTGEGIRYAIISARLAAEAIVLDDVTGYEAAIWGEVGHSLATAGLLASLFYRWPRRSFQLGLRNPATIWHFLDLLAGRTTYQGIGRRLITSTARWFLAGRRSGG
jgi:geranylgeranyl reductase family protein